MIKLNGHIVTPTIFPDGTSQIWKLDLISNRHDNLIEWQFENESELIHVAQLGLLLCKETDLAPNLSIPFLPYARQDKPVSNNNTFALTTFLQLMSGLRPLFSRIETIDVHNNKTIPIWIINESPNDRIKSVLQECKPDLVCYPDAGASARGYDTQGLPYFSLDKKRNQLTGEIEGLECKLPLDLKGKSVIILDDICDGGRTFIEATKLLYNMGASEVHLYTTHGLYTKGVDVLKQAGIKRVFNYKGEV